MNRTNWPWRIFLGVIGLIVLVYTGFSAYRLYSYLTLTTQVPVDSIHWSIHSFEEETFAPQAEYTFTVDGKTFSNISIWNENDRYFNVWALEQPLARLAEKQWKVWYNSRNPAHSSLQKNFPTKECISTAILWLLLVYFIGLGKYAEKKRSQYADNHSRKLHPRRRAAASHISSGKRDESDQL